MTKFLVLRSLSLLVLELFAMTLTTTRANWVGPTIGVSTDSACYRKSHLTTNCPLGFETGNLTTCWAECPLAYPVECGMECIPQNADCATEIFYKVSAGAYAALNLATLGLFGNIKKASEALQFAVTCGIELVSVTRSLVRYLRHLKTTDPNTTTEHILAVVYQANVVVVEMPQAAARCLNIPVPKDALLVDEIMGLIQYIILEVVANDDAIIRSSTKFLEFLSGPNSPLASTFMDLDTTSSQKLTEVIESNSNCGWDIKALTDQATQTVIDLKNSKPDASEDDIRAEISKSALVLSDIPRVTNDCMAELGTTEAAYTTRDNLRKTFGIILDDLIETSKTDNGEVFTAAEYARKVADKSLIVLSIFDPTGLANLAAEMIQPICGPTEFIGEIDDGSLTDALGLATVEDAFKGSEGTWTKVGDGSVIITLESTDEEDVTVNIMSAGDEIDEVEVLAGETVTWTSTVAELEGKTLYMDRWRPGFLGLPGSGGGSLKLWVPRAPSGGRLELTAKINVSRR